MTEIAALRARIEGCETGLMAVVHLVQFLLPIASKVDPHAVETELRQARLIVQEITHGRAPNAEEQTHRKIAMLLERGLGRETPDPA